MKTLLASLLLICPTAFGQVFPVRVSLQLTPPYTPYFSDYSAPGSQVFMLNITMADASVTDYHCCLRLVIEGPGVTIRTNADYAFAPLVLREPHVPNILFGPDLREYFQPEALEITGLSPGEHARLPEGMYRFSAEVLDYHRGTVVSNRAIATAWIILNDPPILTLPLNRATTPVQDPPSIAFGWTPRHTASPNAALTTTYTFRLLELWPEDRSPYDAFLSSPSLYEVVTNQTNLVYGADAPALLPGRKYAWQVQARDESGRDLFRNEGRSEVFVFQFGEALSIPQDLRMRWAKPTTLAIRWNAIKTSGDVRYRLQYRVRRRSEPHEWHETWTRFTDKTLYDLRVNTEYEFRVRSENDAQVSAYSEISVFKTLREEEGAFVCRDDIVPPPAPEGTTPVFPLAVNDTIHAAGYRVLVRDVIKDGSRYHGSGLAIVPWLNSAKVRVTFEKITVNNGFSLTSGTIRSLWNSNSTFVLQEETPIAAGAAPQTGELDITVTSVDSLITIEGAAIAAVTNDSLGNIIVTTTDGAVHIVPPGRSVAIADELGNGYVVDSDGNVAKTTASEARATAERGARTYNVQLDFVSSDGAFGFDSKQHDALSHYYQQVGDGTYIAWKALSSAASENLGAVVRSPDIRSDRITFEAGERPVAPVQQTGNMLMLALRGKAAGIEEELVAMYSTADSLPAQVIGKINLTTYNPLQYYLEIIPVNNAQLPSTLDAAALTRHLNKVYSQAVVSWNVTIKERLAVDLADTFDDGTGQDAFANYTDDMKKVLRAHGDFRDNTWYLFIVDHPQDPSTLGYMPRNKPAGFVFSGPHAGDADGFLKTVSHELGHGAFNLRHPFSEYNLPAGSTDNLMDYGAGTALYKYQWDRIHEPRAGIGIFEGGGDDNLKSGLATFYEDAGPLLMEAPYRQWAEKLRKVYEFLRACNDEEWESYNGRGIFPYCFWRDEDIPSYRFYSAGDLAFMAGVVDGAYVELEGMYHLPGVLREVSRFPGKLLYAYTLAYWQCRDAALYASFEEYEYVIERIAGMERESGPWNWIREKWHDYKGKKETLEEYFQDCTDAEDLREAIEDLYDLATNWEQLTVLSSEVFDKFMVYWDTLGTSGNHGRYERGALLVPTATLVVPLGVGIATKAEKVKEVFRVLRELKIEDIRKVVDEIAKITWRSFEGILPRPIVTTFHENCIKSGYKFYYEGSDLLFLNNRNELVGRILDNNIFIKIPDKHGVWAMQSNTTKALTALEKVNGGAPLYKIGTRNYSTAAEAQYWSLENPLDIKDIKTLAKKYGIPPDNLKSGEFFVQVGRPKENIPWITREAPGFGTNRGGSIEIVVPENGVRLDAFHTLTFE